MVGHHIDGTATVHSHIATDFTAVHGKAGISNRNHVLTSEVGILVPKHRGIRLLTDPNSTTLVPGEVVGDFTTGHFHICTVENINGAGVMNTHVVINLTAGNIQRGTGFYGTYQGSLRSLRIVRLSLNYNSAGIATVVLNGTAADCAAGMAGVKNGTGRFGIGPLTNITFFTILAVFRFFTDSCGRIAGLAVVRRITYRVVLNGASCHIKAAALYYNGGCIGHRGIRHEIPQSGTGRQFNRTAGNLHEETLLIVPAAIEFGSGPDFVTVISIFFASLGGGSRRVSAHLFACISKSLFSIIFVIVGITVNCPCAGIDPRATSGEYNIIVISTQTIIQVLISILAPSRGMQNQLCIAV